MCEAEEMISAQWSTSSGQAGALSDSKHTCIFLSMDPTRSLALFICLCAQGPAAIVHLGLNLKLVYVSGLNLLFFQFFKVKSRIKINQN